MHLNKPIESVDQINSFAQSYLDEFAQCNSREETKPQHCPVIKWKVPVNCWYKINFNGAVFCEKEEAGLGVVIRDGQGLPMASLIQKIRFPHSVESVEALAAKRAIQFALELRLQEGEFEGDSKIIMKALKDDRPSHAPVGVIVEDARALSSNLEKVQFNRVKRQSNSIAHALTHLAQHCADLEVWMESVPPAIEHLLSLDLSSWNKAYLILQKTKKKKNLFTHTIFLFVGDL